MNRRDFIERKARVMGQALDDLLATYGGDGGDPVRRTFRHPRTRPRRLVLLADVSGSMAPYARAYLHLMHGAVRASRAEAFVFATRLTHLTRALAAAPPDVALHRATDAAPDWYDGRDQPARAVAGSSNTIAIPARNRLDLGPGGRGHRSRRSEPARRTGHELPCARHPASGRAGSDPRRAGEYQLAPGFIPGAAWLHP